MLQDFIGRLEIEGFGCLQDVKLSLSRIHAFIGPNDSGKSTILRAVQFLSRVMSTAMGRAVGDPVTLDLESDRRPKFLAEFGDVAFELRGDESGNYRQSVLFADPGRKRPAITGAPFQPAWLAGRPEIDGDTTLKRVLSGDARLIRLDPDAMREPSGLIPEPDQLRLHSAKGNGLPGIYDAILNRGDESFRGIQDDLRRRFPAVKNLRLRVVSESRKSLEVELTNGARVPAHRMSEGLLYYLGFAAIQYLEPTSILLVEEPENGLHPVRIAEIMATLREISERTQVLIATHSPLVVNELKADEVTVVTRDPGSGTKVKRISETPHFEERSKVYALGELWLSYANGTNEAPLLQQIPTR